MRLVQRLPQPSKNSRGDTIVEVLVSIAILSIVLGTAYITSSSSLRRGTDAGSRNQAVGYAQEQIERIKNIANSGSGTVPTNPRFCFDPDNPPDDPATILGPSATCTIDNTPYSVVVEYDPAPSRKVYKVTVTWESAGGGQDEMLLYYRAGV